MNYSPGHPTFRLSALEHWGYYAYYDTFWFNVFSIFYNLLTYLLTYLLHGAGNYLKSWLSLSLSKISCFLMEPEGSSPCSQKPATGSYPEPVESSLPHWSLSLRSSLMLSSHLLLGLASGLFPSLPKPCKHVNPPPYMPHVRVTHPPWFKHANNIRRRYRLWSSSLCSFLHDSTSSLLDPNIFSNTLFSKTLSMFFPHSERPSFAPIQYNWQNYGFVYFNL